MPLRRAFKLSGIVWILSLALAPAGISSAQTSEVVIGGTFSRTGVYARFGRDLERGFLLWQDEVNARGGLMGKQVRAVLANDASNRERAVRFYQQLITRADLIFTPYGSLLTGAVMPVAEGAGVPCIAAAAADQSLWENGGRWCVQMLNPVGTFLAGAVELAAAQGARRLALVYRRSRFVNGVMDGARAMARDVGLDVVTVRTYRRLAEAQSEIREVAVYEPDLVLGGGFRPDLPGAGFLPDAIALTRGARSGNVKARLFTWLVGPAFAKFGEVLGSKAEGMTGNTVWKPFFRTRGNARFVEAYRQRWGDKPDAHAAQGYAVGQLIEEAMLKAGSLQKRAVRNALFALNTDTVFGRFRVNAKGLQVKKRNAIVQWQRGVRQVVWPSWLQTAPLR
ncbi:MAG: amino acid ABC transporter substrate-binding protein [Candidatus Binatia bacterium]